MESNIINLLTLNFENLYQSTLKYFTLKPPREILEMPPYQIRCDLQMIYSSRSMFVHVHTTEMCYNTAEQLLFNIIHLLCQIRTEHDRNHCL